MYRLTIYTDVCFRSVNLFYVCIGEFLWWKLLIICLLELFNLSSSLS